MSYRSGCSYAQRMRQCRQQRPFSTYSLKMRLLQSYNPLRIFSGTCASGFDNAVQIQTRQWQAENIPWRHVGTSSNVVDNSKRHHDMDKEPLLVGVVDNTQTEESLNAEWRNRIKEEIPIVIEDILSYYDEIGVNAVRARYRDNMRFEKRLIQSKMRSTTEISRLPVSTVDMPYLMDEDSDPLVIVEDIDEDLQPSEELVKMSDEESEQPTNRSLNLCDDSGLHKPLKLVDGKASLVSNYKTLSDEVLSAIILLRTISEQEWIQFDYPKEDQGPEVEAATKRSTSDEDSDHTVQVIDAEQVKQDLDSGERLVAMSERISSRNENLSTDDYNFVLARLAVSTELLPDEILSRLVTIFEQMQQFGKPDSITYEVILLAFGRRFAESPVAISVVMEVTPDVEWTPKMLEAASAICENRNHHELAENLLKVMEASSVWVPKKAYRSLLNFAKIDDRREYAIRVINHALDSAESINDHSLDKVLAGAVRWRTRNKYGQTIDNSEFFLETLRVMEHYSATYRPGFIVWEALIDAMSIGAKDSPARWKLVVKAFDALRTERPKFCPTHKLLKSGLDASIALLLPELASGLVCRALDYFKSPTTDGRREEYDQVAPMISVKDVGIALEVCVRAHNIPLCHRILQSVSKANFHITGKSELYQIVLNASAKEGNVKETEFILVSMQKAGIRPGSKSYGALMHSYAMANKLDEATDLLEGLESGEIEFLSPTLYDGYILACVRCNAWDRVRTTFEKMRNAFTGERPSAIAAHGLLLASHRGSDPSTARETVEELLNNGTVFSEAAALLSARVLIPELCGPDLSISSLCEQLTIATFEDNIQQQRATELHQLLRVASVEAKRDTKNKPEIWNSVVASMKLLSDTTKNQLART